MEVGEEGSAGLKWRVFYTFKNTASVAQNLE